MLALGERTGLLEHLGRGDWLTPEALAADAGCHARYVREWLWAMAAAGFAEASPAGTPDAFRLRPEYRWALTSAGGAEHWSRITTQITAFARLEDAVAADFRAGAGLPADVYEPLHDALASESAPIFARTLISEVVPRLGLGSALERGLRAADLGCGDGEAVMILAAAYPRSTFLGVDISRRAVERARASAARRGLTNCGFEVANIEPLKLDREFDLLMAANTVHDLADPAAFILDMRRHLAADGVLYLHELSATREMRRNILDPHAAGVLGFSIYHCLPLSLGRGGIAPGGMWGRERYADALTRAGFSQVQVFQAPSDPSNDTFIARR